jgi:hypothetical protein
LASCRRPPSGWEHAVIKLADARAKELAELAGTLKKSTSAKN